MSQVGNAVETVITTAGVAVVLAGAWAQEHTSHFTTDADGRMTYVGIKDIHADITMSFSAAPVSGTNKDINFYAAVNGAEISDSKAHNNLSSGDPGRTTVIWRSVLSTGDFVEGFLDNGTDTINVLVTDAVLRVS